MYQTDKVASGLLTVYEKMFAEIQHQPVKYFEIGIHKGGSLLWASDYFDHPDSRIYGVDLRLDNYLYQPTSQKITTIQADQNNGEQLQTLGQQWGQFDVVVDDGSHRVKETQNCFENLWQYVCNGGYYVVEDWGACYLNRTPADEQYRGMELFVADALLNAQYYDIVGMKIVHKLGVKLHSYAAFKKGGSKNGGT